MSIESGAIREKHLETKYTDRFTPNVIAKHLPELMRRRIFQLALAQPDRTVVPGSRVALTAEIELPPGVHAYSPGVNGYKPIQLTLQPSLGIDFSLASYPSPNILYLEAIQKKVPVFEGKFRITQDASVTASKAIDALRALTSHGRTISINGK